MDAYQSRQTTSAVGRRAITSAALTLMFCVSAAAADRTTFFVPRAPDASQSALPPATELPDAAMGAAASDGWRNYMRLWRAHHDQPDNKSIRGFLGLPLTGTVQATARRGRSAPRWMGWNAGTYQQVDTPHFTIYTHANEQQAKRVAEDLERCYWIWTQMFFPFWEAQTQVSVALSKLGDQDIAEFLNENAARITIRRKLRIVLFRDAAEYAQTLGADNPGIERSTGFYNDDKRTMFLYASEDDDAATRRHELVHQLFREATRSGLGNKKPSEQSGFWIVEGIAGYFESLSIGEATATVGGWNSPRLQFARYRVLQGRDLMPMSELRADGRLAAQRRSDIARWYAHAIAQTHHLMDSDDPKQRIGMYQLLGRSYAVKGRISGGKITPDVEKGLIRFLSIKDADIVSNPITRPITQLCLTGCEITSKGLQQIPPSPELRWLDLARMPITNDDVRRLAPNPDSIEQLTLEVTKIDSGLAEWLAGASKLRELDLSWTPMDDTVIKAISGAENIQVLWMTGTKVTDASIDTIIKMKSLASVDLQRTKVTAAGVARLKESRPQLSVNPLELRTK